MRWLPPLLLLLPSLAFGAADDELAPRVRLHTVTPGPELGDGLTLRDGRSLYRGPRYNRNVYPYLVAANEAEIAEKTGIELQWSNLHQLLETFIQKDAAIALTRWMLGGEIVPNREAYDRLLAVARAQVVPPRAWGVTVKDHEPTHFGLTAIENKQGFTVRGTIFTTSGSAALCVVEFEVQMPHEGPFTISRRTCIAGPPQAWQTDGDVDEEAERRLHEYVAEFRFAMLEALRSLSLVEVRSACREGATFARVRHLLGEPLRDVGSGRHLYVYRLADGRAVVFGVVGEDEPLQSATIHESFDPEQGLGPAVEELLEKC